MGGTVDKIVLSGTASGYPDLHSLSDAVEVERTQKTALKIICVHDMWANDEDGVSYWVQRDFAVLPDQIRFEFAPDDVPPPPENVIKYVNTSVGVPLYGRDQPTTAGKIIVRLWRGDKLELKPGWTATANGFTWWQILKVNGVSVSGNTPTYAVDKYMSDTDPN